MTLRSLELLLLHTQKKMKAVDEKFVHLAVKYLPYCSYSSSTMLNVNPYRYGIFP